MNRLFHFPALEGIHYFDYAATTFMPECVMNAWIQYHTTIGVGVDRGKSHLSAAANKSRESSLKKLESFLGTDTERTWILAKNVTEAVNLVALGLRNSIQPMDYIMVGPFEHHSNYIPWRQLAKDTGAVFIEAPIDSEWSMDYDYIELIKNKIKVFSFSSIANTNGYRVDFEPLLKLLPESALVCCDVSQQVGHTMCENWRRIDVLFVPSHKMYGPKNVAGAAIRQERVSEISPILLGGGMVQSIGMDMTWAEDYRRYAAGTFDIGLLCAWATAAEFLNHIGFDAIQKFEEERFHKIISGLKGMNATVYSNARCVNSIISFTLPGIHPHDLEYALSENNIVLRSGNLCSQNSIRRMETDAVSRISLGIGVSDDDVDTLLNCLEDLKK